MLLFTVAIVVALLLHAPDGVVLPSVLVPPMQLASVPVMLAGKGLTVTGVVAKQPLANEYVIFGVPAATPVTIPVPVPTSATDVLLLLQLPKPEGSLRLIVLPTHTLNTVDAVIGSGVGFTVTTVVVKQPVASVYVIVDVPGVTPLVTPVDEFTVATAVVALVHTPDGVMSASVVVAAEHTIRVPVMFAGNGLTVTTAVLIQPVGSV